LQASKRSYGLALLAALLLRPLALPGADAVRVPIKAKGAGALFRVHHGALWGYMDRGGKIVISPRFQDAADFFEGLAAVRENGKWGYANEEGIMEVAATFEAAGDFRGGIAPVLTGRRWGFINPKGTFVIEARFLGVGQFSDGLAEIEEWDSIKCGQNLFSKDSAPLYAFRLHTPSTQNGPCFPAKARFGYINKRGEMAIAAMFAVAGEFSEGRAVARAESTPESKYGYIDTSGKFAVKPQFDEASVFSESLAAVETGFQSRDGTKISGKWGYIDQEGVFVIPPRFDQARNFSGGLAEASLRSGFWGYINRRGTFVISSKYSETTAFSDGLALVWPAYGEDGYYIDKTGRTALIPKVWPQWPFSDSLTVAGSPGQRVYLDRTGKLIAAYEIDPRYE
jgi:hypothetical protein